MFTNLGENKRCLPLLPSVVTLHTILYTNGKYEACSVAWAGELSAIFVVKLKQHSK